MYIYWGRHSKTAKLEKIEIKSRESFYEHFIQNPPEEKKGGPYITTASEVELTQPHGKIITDFRNTLHFRRNNQTHKKSQMIMFDGDSTLDSNKYCIQPSTVTATLRKLKLNHIIYTTASHTPKNPKWRGIIWCAIEDSEKIGIIHLATVKYLYKLLVNNGCKSLKLTNESLVLSQMWFLPIASDDYQCWFYNEGEDLQPQNDYEELPDNSKVTLSEYQSYEEIIRTIVKGESPLHSTIGKYIYGAIKDGRNPAEIIATLHGLTSHYNLKDKRLKSRKDDIARRVEAARTKFLDVTRWEAQTDKIDTRVYTDYPDQGGNFERLVQINMKLMIYPNRPIAVTAARFQISVLGGRVYTGTTGKGIVQTILLTGRSTIGKGFVKKNSKWLFNNILLNNYAGEFLGAKFYTSVKNFVEDADGRYSLGSIRTESGQSDKSQAGDMSRVRMYELEAATESGENGFISSGAQNDRVPELYSPAITTVRESVAEIQNEADILLQTAISGIEGRRSYVVADPEKTMINDNLLQELPEHDKEWLKELLTLTLDDRRKKWTEPMPKDLWIRWGFEDRAYVRQRQKVWLEWENAAYKERDIYATTIFGRMIERVPAYAAILAICDNPSRPIITNKQIDIAEASLIAEMKTHRMQHTTGELGGPWNTIEKKMKEIFSGDMTRHINKYDKKLHSIAINELKRGYLEWTPITRIMQKCEEYRVLKETRDFHRIFQQQAESWDIILVKGYETNTLFGHHRRTFKRA